MKGMRTISNRLNESGGRFRFREASARSRQIFQQFRGTDNITQHSVIMVRKFTVNAVNMQPPSKDGGGLGP